MLDAAIPPDRVAELLRANNDLVERERALRRTVERLGATVEALGNALAKERRGRKAAERKASASASLAAAALRGGIEAERTVRVVRQTLLQAAAQFDFYAKAHRRKGTPEAEEKAHINAQWSARCRAAAGVEARHE